MYKKFFKKALKETLKLLDIKIGRYSRYLEHLKNLDEEKVKEKLFENKIKDLENINKDFENTKNDLDNKIKDLEQEIIYLKEKNSYSKKILKTDFFTLDKNSNSSTELLHVTQIYLSDNEAPPGEITNLYINTVKENFSKYKYTLYNNQMIEKFIGKYFDSEILKTYRTLKPFSYKSDFARFCILYIHGGWYLDVGLKSVYGDPEHIHSNDDIDLIAFRDIPQSSGTSWACSGAMFYSKPGHPVLEKAIMKIVINCKNNYYGLNPLFPTGPVVWGSSIAAVGINTKTIIGDFIELTSNCKTKNYAFILPSGKILAQWKPYTNGGRLNEIPGNIGTNDYNKFWFKRNVYIEKELEKNENKLKIVSENKIMRNLDLREIPAIYINLEKHVEKNQNMQKILKECGFKNIIRVEGVDRPNNTVAGCASAHFRGLSELEPPFILFEDDCQIKNFKAEIEIPTDSDAVYLGISHWGRMNGHSGPYVQYKYVENDLYRVFNMLSGHSILYLNDEYVGMCQRICEYAGDTNQDYHDIGFAEIQRWFNIYAFDNPFFYQTSAYDGTVNALTSYPTEECITYNKQYFLPNGYVRSLIN